MRFERAILGVGAAATALFALLGIEAFGRPLGPPLLVRHALLGGLACLLHLFAQGWILVFLGGLGRAAGRAGLLAGEPARAARRLRRRAIPWALALLLPSLGTFLAGGAAFSGRVPGWLHAALFLVAVPLQIAALWRERALLAAHERLLAAPPQSAAVPAAAGPC
ncbi:MAG: hypothetical protein KJ058_08815 [Thermoanaerobaculia bacterium]|nr:hypothetical protein [Thermoanaerobaculia bacterium]